MVLALRQQRTCMQVDYAPLLPEGPLKFAAVVLVGHLAWGYLEYRCINLTRRLHPACA
jgi:hypothetical protein